MALSLFIFLGEEAALLNKAYLSEQFRHPHKAMVIERETTAALAILGAAAG